MQMQMRMRMERDGERRPATPEGQRGSCEAAARGVTHAAASSALTTKDPSRPAATIAWGLV